MVVGYCSERGKVHAERRWHTKETDTCDRFRLDLERTIVLADAALLYKCGCCVHWKAWAVTYVEHAMLDIIEEERCVQR